MLNNINQYLRQIRNAGGISATHPPQAYDFVGEGIVNKLWFLY
jgi:hypothetical protein